MTPPDSLSMLCRPAAEPMQREVSRVLTKQVSNRTVRSAVIGLGMLTLACGCAGRSIAQTAADVAVPDTVWTECLEAPTRACVLRRGVQVAQSIVDARSRSDGLTVIADAQFEAGLTADGAATIDQALRAAQSIGYEERLDDIAQVLAKAGRFAEARQVARSIANQYLQATAVALIAVAEGKAGDIGEALQSVQAIENAPQRARAIRRAAWGLRSVAVKRGEDDRIVAALKQGQAIEEVYPLPKAFTGIHHPS
jgi:hypothetical protein